MLVYGAGFVAIYLLFFLMYRNASKRADEVELSPMEIFETKTVAGINLICILICVLAMSLTYFVPANAVGSTGFAYFLIPLGYSTWYSYRGKKFRQTFNLNR
jgi:hypothetical protein